MKKNPLNDLDQFLQQEASSLVAPSSLSEKLKQPSSQSESLNSTLSKEQLIELAKHNPQQFYDALIAVGEKMNATKNTLLINTALYLKGGDNWKEVVKEYWSK